MRAAADAAPPARPLLPALADVRGQLARPGAPGFVTDDRARAGCRDLLRYLRGDRSAGWSGCPATRRGTGSGWRGSHEVQQEYDELLAELPPGRRRRRTRSGRSAG